MNKKQIPTSSDTTEMPPIRHRVPTPLPLYQDPNLFALKTEGNINCFDVLQNYAHTKGTYLLDDFEFQYFSLAYGSQRILGSIIQDFPFRFKDNIEYHLCQLDQKIVNCAQEAY